MARWYEAANESAFKTVAEGYVFQSPNPWIFARPRYYLVNQTQKTAILAHFGRWRLVLLISILAVFVLVGSIYAFVTLSPATFIRLAAPVLAHGSGALIALTVLLMTLLVVPLTAVPQIYLIRGLRPLLADAPRTEQRIKVGEQLPKIAASISTKVLVVGIVGGLGMIAGGVMTMLDAFWEGRLAGSTLYGSSFLVFAGGLFIAYFLYLRGLKAKQQRTAV